MPVLGAGRGQAYQIPAFKEFHVRGDDNDYLSPDTLKVVEDEKQEIIDKSKSDELKKIEPGGSDSEKVIAYFKAIVARMGTEELTNRIADLPLPGKKERFKDTFSAKSSRMLKVMTEGNRSPKVTKGMFKNMMDAMMNFRGNLDRSHELIKRGRPAEIVDLVWAEAWDSKIRRISPELRQKPSRAERPKGDVFDAKYQRPKGGVFDAKSERPKGGAFDPKPERPKGGAFDPKPERPKGGAFDPKPERPKGGAFDPKPERPKAGVFDPKSERPKAGVFEEDN